MLTRPFKKQGAKCRAANYWKSKISMHCSKLSEGRETFDCAIKMDEFLKTETNTGATDAVAKNFENIICIGKMLHYDWQNIKGIQLRRGKALIFYDKMHTEEALKMENCFRQLNYLTSLHSIRNIGSIIGMIFRILIYLFVKYCI
jgi:hypothetical protein